MKLNIKKLQSGGGLFFSAVANPYSNAAVADRAAQTKASSSGKDSGLISDKLMEKLYEKGIPNDVEKFMNMLADFEEKTDFGIGVSKRLLYNLLAYANLIIKQSEYLDKAEKAAETNGAWDEFAVDARGNLFVPGKDGKITKVHASEFDASKQAALTVGELLEQRKFNPNLTDASDIVTAIGSNVGIEKINDYILGIIRAVGSTDNTSEAYLDLASIVDKSLIRRPSEELQAAIQQLYGLVLKIGPDALFKIKDQYKSKNMDSAISYIFSMLPNNMRTQLIARNVAEGGEYKNSNKYAWDIIAGAAMAGNDIKYVHGMDYESGVNKAAGTAAGQKELSRNLGVLEQLVQGTLGLITYNLTSNKMPSASMLLHGSGIGNLADFDNNIIGKAPISVIMDSALAPIVDLNHISAGGEKIGSEYLDTILYDGGAVINVWAPVDGNGDVDLELLKLFTDILNVIKNNPQLTTEDKNNLLLQYNLDGEFDSQGNFHGGSLMEQFLVFTGLTSEKIVDPDVNYFADKLNDREKENALSQILRIYGQLNKGIKNKDGQYEFKMGLFDRFTDLVRVPIFMKLSRTANIDAETFSGKGPMVTTPSYQQMLAYDQMRNKPKINTPSTGLLYE